MALLRKRSLLIFSACAGAFTLLSTQAQVDSDELDAMFNANCDATLESASGESLERLLASSRGAMGTLDSERMVAFGLRIELSDAVLMAERASISPAGSGVVCLESARIVANALP